jgi:hypothetical protein
MRTRGQIEMMGLVVIVVLLVMIALFSLFFISRGTSVEEDNVYYSLRAYNFANSLIKSSVGNTNMEALILNCCEGSGSCETLLDFAESKFSIFSDEESKFELSCGAYSSVPVQEVGNCENGVASEYLELYSGDRIRVFLCGK